MHISLIDFLLCIPLLIGIVFLCIAIHQTRNMFKTCNKCKAAKKIKTCYQCGKPFED